MWNEELSGSVAYNPSAALMRASEGRSVVEGLVPRGGVTWLYGPSMSFKSFITMSMAASVSTGTPWLGRKTIKSAVLYLGAEGGDGLHVRRAAAEMAAQANTCGVIAVAQERPMLDTALGAFVLRGALDGLGESAFMKPIFEQAICERVSAIEHVSAAEAAYEVACAAFDKLADKTRRSAKEQQDYEEAEARVEETEEALSTAKDDAHLHDKTLGAWFRTKEAYTAQSIIGFNTPSPSMSVLCIIDTYSQTAEDDNRRSVSAYIKNLRTLIEEAQATGITLSFVVVDHVTKEGSTYLGSVAKLNDVDSQIEVARLRKSLLATITQTKSKDCVESPALNVEMVPFEIPGFRDAEGRPLSTLVARDGSNSAAAVALNPEGNVATLCELLQGAEGIMAESELKAAFRQVKIAAGVKPESADKAYRRAMQALREDGGIREADGEISLA